MTASYESISRFTGKRVFEKAVNSLIGIIEGISIDSSINDHELGFINAWMTDHRIRADKHPFNELFPVLENALEDGVLTEEERADILWLCEKLTSTEFVDQVTADMQKLHAILAAVAADGVITVDELRGISAWLNEHDHLKNCWPYDEVEGLILSVLEDKVIDEAEHKLLLGFFSEFIAIMDNRVLANPVMDQDSTLVGVCSVCPEITFDGAVFCLTGESERYKRKDFVELIEGVGGVFSSGMNQAVNYLVVGAKGNASWAYACYGRKVEQAVKLRKQGHSVVIVHENDFYDAVEDL